MRTAPSTSSQLKVPSSILSDGGVSGQIAAPAARFGARRALLISDSHLVATGLAQSRTHRANPVQELTREDCVAVPHCFLSVDVSGRRRLLLGGHGE